MPVEQTQTTTRFGIFELDTGARELYRKGVRIRLAPQPLDLLIALVERPGAVVTRETLQQRLWPPGTFVDFDHGLNKAVRKLRETLGDSAESPRYVETVQRSGYRFIAPVLQPETPAPPAPAPLDLSPSAAASRPTLPPSPVTQHVATEDAAPLSRPRESRSFAAVATGLLILAALGAIFVILHKVPARSVESSASSAHDPRAQEAYLHGRYLWFGGHQLAASDYFKRAIEIEPDYGAAWAGMSMYYGASLINGRIDPTAALGLMQDAAAKALRFAPTLADSHLASCGSIFLNSWQYQPAAAECDKARQLAPSDAEIRHFQSKMLAAVHHEQEAVEVQRIASRLDPLSKPWEMTQALMQARLYDEAFAEGRARLETFPHDPRLLYNLAFLSLYRGNPSQFADYLEQSYLADGDEASAAQVHEAFRRNGVPAISLWRLERLQHQAKTGYVSPFHLALAYMAVGDREHALAQLEVALNERAPDMLWLRCHPEFDPLANESRYREIVAKLPSL